MDITEHVRAINDRDGNEITRVKQELLAMADAGATIEELSKPAGELMAMSPFSPLIVGPKELRLFRALPFGEVEACLATSRMHYPPAHLASHGRANRAGTQLLYVSTSPVVAVIEAQTSIGQHFVLAEYETIEAFAVTHAGVYNSPSRDFLSERAKNLSPMVRPHLTVYGEQNLREAHRWLGELFMSKDKKYYPLTTALAEILLMPMDGVLYPSLNETRQYNFAFKPPTADRKFKPVQYWRGILKGREPRGGEQAMQTGLYNHATSVDDSGTISWTGANPTVLPPQ